MVAQQTVNTLNSPVSYSSVERCRSECGAVVTLPPHVYVTSPRAYHVAWEGGVVRRTLRPQEGGSEVNFEILRYVVELDLNFQMLLSLPKTKFPI